MWIYFLNVIRSLIILKTRYVVVRLSKICLNCFVINNNNGIINYKKLYCPNYVSKKVPNAHQSINAKN